MKEELAVHEAGRIAAQETVPAEVMLFPQNDATIGTGTISSISGVDDELDNNQKRTGRPKGTSLVGQDAKTIRRFECINETTNIYRKKILEEKNNNSIGIKNDLKKLIVRKWEEYCMDPVDIVSVNTVRSRVRRGGMDVLSRGAPRLLPVFIEDVIADVFVTMAKIRHPLCLAEMIAFANSLIQKSAYQLKIREWKKKNYQDLPDEE